MSALGEKGWATPQAAPRKPYIRIQPTSGWSALNLGDLWRYRELLFILAQRDIKLRYKQTALGVTWVILQPLIAAAIFAVVFGRLVGLSSDGAPYLLFAYVGVSAWNYFSGAVSRAGNSLVGQANLITKIYFPRLLMPLASTLSVLVDLAVSFVLLVVLMLLYRVVPGWEVVTLPFFLLLITILAAGVSLWLSALGVYYRDFIFAMPFLIQVWLYASPVIFSTTEIPERWRWAFALNPMVAGIEGVRWAILGESVLTMQMTVISSAVAVLLFLSGLFFFRRVERTFADVI
jgi:lipopolysaccharide transport system permease protein